jgi:oxygen-independent coproporphyrinogen-3 oxidase
MLTADGAASQQPFSWSAFPLQGGVYVISLPDLPRLLDRYERPGPRYTSYPPIPSWSAGFGEADYRAALTDCGDSGDPVAVYVHLPFCIARCFYCGCNATVTRDNAVQRRYLDRLEREFAVVGQALYHRPRAVQIHWGGGTPNFLPLDQMVRLADVLAKWFRVTPGAELSIEADPRLASPEQFELLRRLGFTRLSLGVQDLDPGVQAAIGRRQSEAEVREAYTAARAAGFGCINLDLVYGLPGQTRDGFARTLDAIVELRPERIACFGYAHVPWVRPNQKRIDPSSLPTRDLRFSLIALTVERLTAAGYVWVGLDHYARPEDELTVALGNRALRRNFMGYTVNPAPHLLAFGMSGIGEVAGRYVQNHAHLGVYQSELDEGRLPVARGHRLTADDRRRRDAITELMCNLELTLDRVAELGADPTELFAPFAADGLVTIDGDRVAVTPPGRFFLRNICMGLDAYSPAVDMPTYSRTI